MAFPHATPDLESMLVFDAGSVTQRSIQCRVMQCSPWDETLTKILSCPAIHVLAYWGNKKTNTLLATHVSASGACPAVRLLPLHGNDSASAVFTNEHKQCSRSGKAIVVRIGGTRELLLTATFSSDEQGRRTPVFWGYVLLHHLATAVADMMQMGRLALVFDLDETLLVANSSSTLENKAGACRRARHGIAKELEALGEAASEAERARLQLHDLACQKEEELLQLDQELLKQFADNDYVRISGQPVRARYESVTLEDGTLVNRPVIRVEVAGVQVILTRIDPKVRETSMILRLRPGWEDLRAFLAGENDVPGPDGKPKQRFQVFVCTAAERQYALEAWRLLDVSSSLIPLEQRSKRIVNVSGAKKKSVLETLGVLKQRLAKRNGAQQSQADDLEEADMRGVMPLALVIDDRVEVWEASSQPHILQVVPWAYYRDEARRLAGVPSHMAAISEVELRRVWASAMRLRSETFHSINVVVKAQLDCFMRAGAPEAMQTPQLMQQLLPRVQTVPVLLRDLRCEALYAMPSVATASIAAAAVAVVLEPPGAPAASTPAAAINSLSGLPKGDVQLGPPPSRPPAPSPERLAPAAVARLAEVAEQLLTGRPPRRAAALLPSPTPLKQPLAADMKAASATALPGERLAPARQLPTPAAARADAVAPGPSHQGPTSKPLAADAGAESAAPLSEAHKTPGDDQTKMRRLTQLRFGVKPARLRQQVPVAGSQAEVAGQAADLPAQPPQEQQPLTVCNELQQHWQQQGLQQQQQQPQREHGGRPHDVPAQQQQQSQQQQQQQQQLQQQQQQQSRQQQGRQPHDVPMQQQQAGGQPQGMPTQKLQQQVQPEVVSAEQQQQQQPLVQMQPQRQPDARPHCRPSAMNGQQQSQLLQEHLKNNMVMIRPSKRVTEAEQGHALWGTGPPQAQEVVVVTDEMDADDSGQVFQQQDPELSQCKKRPQGKSSQKRRDKRRKLQQLLLLQRSQTGSESKDGSVGVHPAAATARREGLLQRHGAEEVPSSSNNPVDAGDYDEDAAMAGADANTNNIPADTGVNVEVAGQAATQRWKEANKCWREAKKEWTKLRSSGQLEPGVNVDAADKWSKAKKDWTKAKKEWTKLHRANIGMSVTSGGNGAGNSVTAAGPLAALATQAPWKQKARPSAKARRAFKKKQLFQYQQAARIDYQPLVV